MLSYGAQNAEHLTECHLTRVVNISSLTQPLGSDSGIAKCRRFSDLGGEACLISLTYGYCRCTWPSSTSEHTQ